MSEIDARQVAANKLKAAFDRLWEEALSAGDQTLAHRDMARIAETLRAEGPALLTTDAMPSEIDAGLHFALAAVDPSLARAREELGRGLFELRGAAGLSLAVLCLEGLIDPGAWALVVAFATAGRADGAAPAEGVAAGLRVAARSIVAAMQALSPQQRAGRTRQAVQGALEAWAECGREADESAELRVGTFRPFWDGAEERAGIGPALATMMLRVAEASADVSAEELQVIEEAIGDAEPFTLELALDELRVLPELEKLRVVELCCHVAMADGSMDSSERLVLQHLVTELGLSRGALSAFAAEIVGEV